MSDEQTPTWRYLVPGLLLLSMAGYMLVTGEMAVDKKGTMTITRTADPAIYWVTVAVTGTLGVLALRKVWQRLSA